VGKEPTSKGCGGGRKEKSVRKRAFNPAHPDVGRKVPGKAKDATYDKGSAKKGWNKTRVYSPEAPVDRSWVYAVK